jgi:hypothetical protein
VEEAAAIYNSIKQRPESNRPSGIGALIPFWYTGVNPKG